MHAKGRILVVEDEAIVAMDIMSRINKLGHTVVGSSSSGESAIEKAGALRPDLVLMDIGLKGSIDGVEAAKAIRRNLNIPVIFLSANSDANTLKRVKDAGPLDYIKKPFDQADLANTIEKAIYMIKQGTDVNGPLYGIETVMDSKAALITRD